VAHPQQRVLFLCTGNACRSQMAEAIVNARLANRWQAFSAGLQPAGFVHTMVYRVLEEIGINYKGRSKGVEEVKGMNFNLVVTLCSHAEEECPVWLGPGKRVHQEYFDPIQVAGTEEEKLKAFRKLRYDMLLELPYLLNRYEDRKLEL
jgi:arsenate reductase